MQGLLNFQNYEKASFTPKVNDLKYFLLRKEPMEAI